MTRQTSPGKTGDDKAQGRKAGATVPDKPRDCAPHVDTWPILDEQVGDAPKQKTDEYGNRN